MPIMKSITKIDYVALAAEVSRKLDGNYDPGYVRNVHRGFQRSGVILKAIEEILAEQAQA